MQSAAAAASDGRRSPRPGHRRRRSGRLRGLAHRHVARPAVRDARAGVARWLRVPVSARQGRDDRASEAAAGRQGAFRAHLQGGAAGLLARSREPDAGCRSATASASRPSTATGGGFLVRTTKGELRAASVLLAIGRRGTPRKLGVPGEDLPKVVYRLIDPEQYAGQHVLVVGGGDSALEAAASVAEGGGPQRDAVVSRRCVLPRQAAQPRARRRGGALRPPAGAARRRMCVESNPGRSPSTARGAR